MATSSAVWINTMDPKQSTADSMGSLLFTYAREGNTEKVREILEKGQPLATDTVGTTALHCAVVGDSLQTCELLIKAGVNVESKTKVDRTPLHLAAYGGHHRIVGLLFERNCTVDPVDMLLMTPLHWAVEKRHPRVVQMLLDRGANPLAVSKFRKTPLSIAQDSGDEEIVALINSAIEMRPSRNQLVKSEYGGRNREIIKYEIEEDGDDDGSISVFEVDENLDADDGEVEVIPSGETESMDLSVEECEEATKDESHLQILHESINKLGNIRGLKQADAPTLKILQNIGISMLPTEDPDTTLLANALQSGRNIILSEAGKYILNKTKSNSMSVPGPMTSNSSPRQGPSNSALVGKASGLLNRRSPLVPHSPTSLVKPSVSSVVNATSGGRATATVSLGSRTKRISDSGRFAETPSPSNCSEPNSLIDRTTSMKRANEDSGSGKSKVVLKEIRRAQQPWIQKLGMVEGSSSPVLFNSLDGEKAEQNDAVEVEIEEVEEEGSVEEVPLNRIQKMEQQILSLSRENKQLRNKLELSYKLIDENRKRIERLEEADPEKKRSNQAAVVEFI